MSCIPPNEKIIEKKICRISGQQFFVTDKDLAFYEKISPVFAGNKYLIPSPTLCPDERMRRRLSWRNERKLYHRKCDLSGKQIISIYSPEKPYLIYNQGVWWGDNWSPMIYGIKFNFDKTFFEQFSNILKSVPRPHVMVKNSINCEFTNFMIDSRNCYLSFASSWSENIAYCSHSTHSKNSYDCTESTALELCYYLVDCKNCYLCSFSQKLENCKECDYCFDLENCSNCLYCENLRNKSYHISNKPVSKEEFAQKKKDIVYSSYFTNIYYKLCQSAIRRENWNKNSIDVLGEYIYKSTQCYFCYDIEHGENLRYCNMSAHEQKDSYDCTGSGGQKCYESCLPLNSFGTSFSENINNSNSAYYSSLCFGVSNIFGCVGLHSHENNCILNVSYGKKEYEKLCIQIIDHMKSTGEWGEFFPTTLSPFGYDETVAMEHFPLTREEVEQKGWKWKGEEETSSYHGPYYTALPIQEYNEKIVGHEQATKNIDDVLNGILKCEITGKPFKVIKQELVFHIENNIPLPKKHPDQRHKERLSQRNPRKIYDRTCSDCGKNIITTFTPERTERIVCEACYQKLVY